MNMWFNTAIYAGGLIIAPYSESSGGGHGTGGYVTGLADCCGRLHLGETGGDAAATGVASMGSQSVRLELQSAPTLHLWYQQYSHDRAANGAARARVAPATTAAAIHDALWSFPSPSCARAPARLLQRRSRSTRS